MNKLLLILLVLFVSCTRVQEIKVFYGDKNSEIIQMSGYTSNTEFYMMDNMLMAKSKKCNGEYKYKIAHDIKIKSFKLVERKEVVEEETTIKRTSKPERGF